MTNKQLKKYYMELEQDRLQREERKKQSIEMWNKLYIEVYKLLEGNSDITQRDLMIASREVSQMDIVKDEFLKYYGEFKESDRDHCNLVLQVRIQQKENYRQLTPEELQEIKNNLGCDY